MRLLTVDDSAMMRRLVVNAGAVIGAQTLEAADAAEAWKTLKREGTKISLVLLDWHMPGMDGLTLLKKIKADKQLAKIPVMMVTSEGERENILKAVRAGAENYLAKPYTQEDLITRIMQCVGEIA